MIAIPILLLILIAIKRFCSGYRLVSTDHEKKAEQLVEIHDSLDDPFGKIEDLSAPNEAVGAIADEEPLPKVVPRIRPQNHHRLAKRLADECYFVITVTKRTAANELAVRQWMKRRLASIPNLRRSHARIVESLAVELMFLETKHDLMIKAMRDSNAFMERRKESQKVNISLVSGIIGWLTGHRRVTAEREA